MALPIHGRPQRRPRPADVFRSVPATALADLARLDTASGAQTSPHWAEPSEGRLAQYRITLDVALWVAEYREEPSQWDWDARLAVDPSLGERCHVAIEEVR